MLTTSCRAATRVTWQEEMWYAIGQFQEARIPGLCETSINSILARAQYSQYNEEKNQFYGSGGLAMSM